MSDWEASDSDTPAKAASPPPAAKVIPKGKTKWEGEDEEDEGPVSDWEASSEEEEEKPAPVTTAAPPKKKGTLKAKLAEKEAAKAAQKASQGDDDEYDSDAVLDPREKARRDRERELQSDLHNATELFGAAALGGTSSSELDSLISFQPRTKEDFQTFSSRIIEYIIKRHQNKPLYAAFVEHHVRALAVPLKDVEVRKAASGLTTLANEKQKEQREKASGKKKSKGASKPALGAAKLSAKQDTSLYDEALDDFGTNPDDFM
ncbi:putative component of the eukaryotic translation initiation factor 3 (eIF-3) complex, which is involved in protein synthesis of a specialized repertoire of mRNAs and, together with other initiation factors, stimulates binding of mRNA and methionyl-tRNAi to the 40S ribosome [Lyophyllum shimeji]|uniref:Eukaryotic translation initiation factor 3 subunit J n=1 Tax=Lyophyllum shimeji TaxID=47721 RepID=A0A9P3URK3_LYOSH|nr:putative component of the eukaryotic translation initiation factor 3 (eIF-3) complex, which is involved in protein synthesis of a specialized repertoire of mRNAs and, together with other initiation factors, stimulates binding of mRNA and methionyl-tRNAi to the 40S ribosome [Lyophyllum shimeji]